jgi:hypothetical protein
MGRSTGASRGGLWRGFRRPLRRDRVFWIAIALCLLAVATETAMTESIADVSPIALAVVALLVVIVVFSVVGAVAGSIRGFKEGFRTGGPAAEPTAAPAREPAGAGPAEEATDGPSTSGGLPKAVADLSESARQKAANLRTPTADDVDRTARKLGRAFGAARRAVRDD